MNLHAALSADARTWLDAATDKVRADPSMIRVLFPAVRRRCGRDRLDENWTIDEAARAQLLSAVSPDALEAELAGLYRHGDRAEQRAVLRALELVDAGQTGLGLVREALRSNDNALIEAALGPFGSGALPIEEYRQAVLKCVFSEIPLAGIGGLTDRADGELARMLADFACERVAAGRELPADIWPVVCAFPADTAPARAAIQAELTSPVPERQAAATRAVAHLTETS